MQNQTAAMMAAFFFSIAGMQTDARAMKRVAHGFPPSAKHASRFLLESELADVIRIRIGHALPLAWVSGLGLETTVGESGLWERMELQRAGAHRLSCEGLTARLGHRVATGGQPLRIRARDDVLSLGERRVHGELWVYRVPAPTGGSACEVINHVALETYLEDVVASEFNTRWSEDAIRAQAIAARTYAVYQRNQARRQARARFDVESSVMDQVYEAKPKRDWVAQKAVRDTSGLVLSATGDARGVIKAFYHSTCGGMTELPQAVWGTRAAGFKSRIPCPYCRSSPKYEWSFGVSEDEFLRLVTADRDSNPFTQRQLVKLAPLKTTPARRVESMLVVWREEGVRHQKIVSAQSLRSRLGATRMLSTRFEIVRNAQASSGLTFNGIGYGHGVGLCQYGAKVMGEKGFRAQQILAHYYPGAKLVKLW